MKHSYLFLLAIFTSLAFPSNLEAHSFSNNKFVTLSGKIENPNSDSVVIRDKNRITIRVIPLKKPENTFHDTLTVTKGLHSFYDGTEQTSMYLKNGFDLYITLDTKQFDETVKYSGKGENENNYLAQKALLNESFGYYNYYGYYGKLKEKRFLHISDSLTNLRNQLLNKNHFDEDFLFIERNGIKFEHIYKLAGYQGTRRFVNNEKSFTVSSAYPDPFEDFDINNEKLLKCSFYPSLVTTVLRKKTIADSAKKDSSSFNMRMLNTLNENIRNKKIKELIAFNLLNQNLSYTKKLDELYEGYFPLISKKEQQDIVTKKYNALKKITKGNVSPTFKLYDLNEKLVSLDDFRGKLVYIDLWATWCLPCLKQIPHLDTIQKEYAGKDIVFVSICKSDKKERWKKMVKKKELGGIQLFAPDDNIDFFKDYVVNGIPHFILIDKKGNIIDAKAPRPSFANLRDLLNESLEK